MKATGSGRVWRKPSSLDLSFLVHMSEVKAAINYTSISGRLISICISARPDNVTIIQVYAPTFMYKDVQKEGTATRKGPQSSTKKSSSYLAVGMLRSALTSINNGQEWWINLVLEKLATQASGS